MHPDHKGLNPLSVSQSNYWQISQEEAGQIVPKKRHRNDKGTTVSICNLGELGEREE